MYNSSCIQLNVRHAKPVQCVCLRNSATAKDIPCCAASSSATCARLSPAERHLRSRSSSCVRAHIATKPQPSPRTRRRWRTGFGLPAMATQERHRTRRRARELPTAMNIRNSSHKQISPVAPRSLHSERAPETTPWLIDAAADARIDACNNKT